jgi:hypothetical protein
MKDGRKVFEITKTERTKLESASLLLQELGGLGCEEAGGISSGIEAAIKAVDASAKPPADKAAK